MVRSMTMESPLGTILLAAGEEGLHGVWFLDQKHFPEEAPQWPRDEEQPILMQARRDLAAFFAGQGHTFATPLAPRGTLWQRLVWEGIRQIPAGRTSSYAALAHALGRPAAARAVGAAVGRNPLSIIIPCHRVVGADGGLRGYAGGLERKRWLLRLEGAATG